jgi:uncharacterized protein involved in outer membrane biogenesis
MSGFRGGPTDGLRRGSIGTSVRRGSKEGPRRGSDDGSRRGWWIALAVVVAVLGAGTFFVFRALDPESLKPRLIAEVERATGRTLTISGRIGIKLAMVPTISIEDVTLSNPPGFSRPEMAKVARVDLSLALVPLLEHRIVLDRVSLTRPDVLLETDATGRRNWVFAREAPKAVDEQARVEAPQPGGEAGGKFAVVFNAASIEDGHIGWIDGVSGQRVAADIPRLTVTAPGGGGIQATGTITIQGREIALTARTGQPVSQPEAWPVALRLESGGATVTADGRIVRPLEGRGYKFSIDGDVPDPGTLASLFPRLPLASLHAVKAHAEVSDSGGAAPVISALTVKAGTIDLDKVVADAKLEDVTLSASGKSPMKVSARVTAGGFESGIGGTVGDLPWLVTGRAAPVAVDLEWNAASARATVKGTIQAPRRFSGFALDVTLNVPNPALVMEDAPPALKSVLFHARLTDSPEPVTFQVTSSAGDLSGALSISRDPRFSVSGRVVSHHLDLDMLRARPVGAPPPAAAGAAREPAPERPGPLIPDAKLPLGLIRAADADLAFDLDQIRLGGTDFAKVNAGLVVKDGVLRLDPLTVADPDKKLSAALTIDTTETPAAVHLTVDSPGFPLGPVLAALGAPAVATGKIEAHADLTGTGDSPRALAATLDGRAGVAIEGGQLDAKTINAWLEQLRPLRIEGGDVTDLRCLAMRADAKSGVVTVDPFALNTAALIVEGSGDVDLGHETLALKLRPRAKIGGTGIALPLRVSGTMRSPSAKVDISAGGIGGKGFAGLLLGGKDIMGAAGGGDPCTGALARARESVAPGGTK